jgi:hypothetical protein
MILSLNYFVKILASAAQNTTFTPLGCGPIQPKTPKTADLRLARPIEI